MENFKSQSNAVAHASAFLAARGAGAHASDLAAVLALVPEDSPAAYDRIPAALVEPLTEHPKETTK